MKTLNLVDLEKSDIKYRISKFPDGQQQVVITGVMKWSDIPRDRKDIEFGIKFIEGPITIKSRLNDFKDLELIICAVASLRELGIKEIHLYAPYIMGARSDRKFEEGGNNYLKDVICPIINSLKFNSVTVLDPHSDCLEMGVKGFRKESNLELVNHFLSLEQGKDYGGTTKSLNEVLNNIILVSPDAGASKKIYKLAEQIGYKGDIITCSKDRDTDGELTKVEVPLDNDIVTLNKDFIIIDDICDGGATFLNISKEIKKMGYTNKIYLIVTHGIFSKGFGELIKYFDGIYCTNSYKELVEYQQVYDNKDIPTHVKQLNVF